MVQNNSQRINELNTLKNEVQEEKEELKKNQNTLVIQLQKEIQGLKKQLMSLNKIREVLEKKLVER